MRRTTPWLIAALMAQPLPAWAQAPGPASAPTVAVRTGDHAGFGRVVLDLVPGVRQSVATDGRTLTVKLESNAGPVGLAAPGRMPRNVVGIVARDGTVELTLAPGARPRSYRMGERLVVDVADPVAGEKAAAPPAAASTPARAAPVPPPAASARAPAQATARAAAPPATPAAPAPVAAVPAVAEASRVDLARGQSPDARHRAREDVPAPPLAEAPIETVRAAPLGLAATLSPGEAPGPHGAVDAALPAVTLPFSSSTGAAALRRGDAALVVFDERRPVDLSPLRGDPVFGGATVSLLPGATVLRVPMPDGHALRLTKADTGWTVTAVPSHSGGRPIRAETVEGRLRLPADAPGQVVAVPDPLTGGTMLVGTQRSAGQWVPVDRRTPEFALLSTWQGVAVLPLTDALALRPHPEGFRLAAAADGALTLSAAESQTQAMTEAASASRRYDLPAQPLEALHRRLQSARLTSAAAQPQARAARRRDVAEAMLALGMGPEMHAVLAATVAEDARAAEDPDIAGLSAIAALLSGRTEQAAAIDDERLTGTDEIAVWRAVRLAQQDPNSARAAAIFASGVPLLLSYPAPLRERLLPMALETMARGGEAVAARTVLERLPEMGALDLARGLVAQRAGDAAAALEHFDRVTAGTDRRTRAVAAREAVELRLASGAITPAQAADALEKLVFAWRGDRAEIAIRLRVAELRAQSGAWRTALALLRELRQLFPEQGEAAGRALADVLARSLAPGAQDAIAPLDLVALAEENADLLPAGPAGHALATRLAEKLVALDLPERARPVLEKLVDQAPPGVARATLGGTLAALRLESGAPAEALAALQDSVAEGPLPPDVLERRTLTFGRAAAATGDLRTGVAALSELGTPPALRLRARLLEEAKDWPAASAALSALARNELPATGPLDADQSRLVLRIAAAAGQAGDERTLSWLRNTLAPRLAQEQLRDLATLLAAAPVQGVADLPRAAQEAKLARAAANSVRALAAPTAP